MPSEWRWALALALGLAFPAAAGAQFRCGEDGTPPVNRVVDLVEDRLFLLAHPVAASGGVVLTDPGGAPTVSVRSALLEEGRMGHRASVLPFEARLSGFSPGDPERHLRPIGRVTLLTVEQYAQTDPLTGLSLPIPILGDVLRPPVCHREWLGMFGELLTLTHRPRFAHLSLRLLRFGAFANLLRTGGTARAWRQRVVLRLGGTWDYVDPGSAPRPPGNGATAALVRPEVSLEGVLSTPDRVLRLRTEVAWRPQLATDGPFEDLQQVEGSLEVRVFLALSDVLVLALRAHGAAVWSRRPWTLVSTFADLRQEWSLLAEAGAEVYWAL